MRVDGGLSDPISAFWALPFAMAASTFEVCLALLPAHHLSAEERDDKTHGQLVGPEPLRHSRDHNLFA